MIVKFDDTQAAESFIELFYYHDGYTFFLISLFGQMKFEGIPGKTWKIPKPRDSEKSLIKMGFMCGSYIACYN